MTENTTTETSTASGAEAQPPEGDAETGNVEAAKYRRRLRDTEAERDAARQAADAAQRALVDHLAESLERVKPAALWASGVTLKDLVDDAGNVDTAKLKAACAAAAHSFGLSRIPKPDPSAGQNGSSTTNGGFSAAFAPR